MARYKPARPDLKVVMPDRGMLMPAAGIDVPGTTYYRNLIRDGDIVPVEPDTTEPGGEPAGEPNPNPDGAPSPTGKRGRKG